MSSSVFHGWPTHPSTLSTLSCRGLHSMYQKNPKFPYTSVPLSFILNKRRTITTQSLAFYSLTSSCKTKPFLISHLDPDSCVQYTFYIPGDHDFCSWWSIVPHGTLYSRTISLKAYPVLIKLSLNSVSSPQNPSSPETSRQVLQMNEAYPF